MENVKCIDCKRLREVDDIRVNVHGGYYKQCGGLLKDAYIPIDTIDKPMKCNLFKPKDIKQGEFVKCMNDNCLLRMSSGMCVDRNRPTVCNNFIGE